MSTVLKNGERPAKRAKLLLAGDSSSDSSDISDSEKRGLKGTNSAKLKINEEYAKRYEHNKKREELHKLEEKYGKHYDGIKQKRKRVSGQENDQDDDPNDEMDSDSESQSEDDEGLLVTETLDAEILSTLKAIQNKDPRVYDKNGTFYTAEDLETDSPDGTKPKEKPLHLRDYHRQNLLAGRSEDEDKPAGVLSYVDEQDALKSQLIKQMHAISDDEEGSDQDTFLTKKPKTKNEQQKALKISEADVQTADRDPETFLSNFMAARAWIPTSSSKLIPFESDDEDEDAKADEFEEGFNLRFEDPDKSNMKLLSHSRDAAAKYSVRREEPKGRRKAREEEQARKLALKAEREEERGRLRNLKIEEAQEKLQKFKEAAGLTGQDISVEQWSKFLEAGWDSDGWDQEMADRFGDNYYSVQDLSASDDEGSGSKHKKPKKPKFGDDIDIDDIIPDFNEDELRAAKTFTLSDDEEQEPEDQNEEGGVSLSLSASRRSSKKDKAQQRSEAKRRARLERQKLEQLVDANLALDSALPSAAAQASIFRYRETSPSSFGLTAQEILTAEDAQLNQYVGLKKLAPFRDADKKRRDRKRLSKKARLRQWRQETFGNPAGPQAPFAEYLRAKLGGEEHAEQSLAQRRPGGEEGVVPAAEAGKKRRRRRKGKAQSPGDVAAAAAASSAASS